MDATFTIHANDGRPTAQKDSELTNELDRVCISFKFDELFTINHATINHASITVDGVTLFFNIAHLTVHQDDMLIMTIQDDFLKEIFETLEEKLRKRDIQTGNVLLLKYQPEPTFSRQISDDLCEPVLDALRDEINL